MQIIDNKALLLRTRLSADILKAIPKSQIIRSLEDSIDEVLVYFGVKEVQALKVIGIKKVPNPPLQGYKWPGAYIPMSHQRVTAEFLVGHTRAHCLNSAGTGKTSAAAWAADYLMSKGLVKRVLVVAPVSIMQAAWQQELFKTLMHRSVAVAYGTKQTRKKIIEAGAEFIIINYDGIQSVLPELQKGGFDLVIADESSNLKNVATDRWKYFNKLLKADTRVWLMTGTPAAQSPEDAYGLAKIVSPDRVPKFFGAWREMVMQKVSMYRHIPRARAKDMVFNALQPAIRFTQEECLDLPPIVYVTRDAPMGAQQQKYYTLMKRQMLMSAGGEEVTAVNAAVNINKILQISCGSVYSDTGEVIRFECKERLSVMDEVIAEAEKKVIIFAPFRHAIVRIVEHLESQGIGVSQIHGDVSASKRAEVINQFQQSDEHKVIVIQPQAAAHGITLTAASTVIWFGPTSSVEYYIQANARAYRKGQDTKVLIVKLQSSEVERKMYEALENRVLGHQSIVDLYKQLLGVDND